MRVHDCTLAETRKLGIYREFSWPQIQDNHIDGPVITFSDGQMHWLTFWQRIRRYWLSMTAWQLQCELRPRLTAEIIIRIYGTPYSDKNNPAKRP